MIPSRGFELRKAQTAAPRAAIRVVIIRAAVIREVRAAAIPEVAIRAVVIPEVAIRAVVIPVAGTRAVAVGEGIPQGADPTAKILTRTLKRTPKCSR
jgi:hypothetical protein